MKLSSPSAVRFGTLVCATLLCLSGEASADETRYITLRAGHSLVLPSPHTTRVGVGDRNIAGVVPLGNSEVVINAKSAGKTTVFIWTGARHITYEVTVTDQALDDLAAMLRSSISEPNVRVRSFDSSVVIKGSVPSHEDSLDVEDVVARFTKVAEAHKFTIVDAVTVAKPLGDLTTQLAATPGGKDLSVERDGKGNLIVSGTVPDRSVAQSLVESVRSHAGTYLNADGKIIDRLAVESTTQVDIKVYILEVDRTAQSQLGLRLQSGTPDPTHPGFYILGSPSFPALESNKPSALQIGTFARTTILAPTLDLILNTGHARILSSPDLVTMPGQESTFLVGGQIPIPYASGPSQIAIEYKDFGVQLKVTPTILGNGSVETLIAPEVSDLDFVNGIAINGFSIPALKTSRLSTDVVTRSGESVVLGGLMRRVEQKNVDKIPLLGDIPILGQLFRSTSYLKSETDLVFVMTPEILVR